MKKILFLLAVLTAAVGAKAQQVAVVSSTGTTSIYRTLYEAVMGAPSGSVVYVPGGAFTIADSVKITKKLTIMGIGHKVLNDNADGHTTISGNLFFNAGSSGSAVIGAHITGNVNIGEGGAAVHDVLVKFCNVNSVQVLNASCLGTQVNQCYVRNSSNFRGAGGLFTNNIAHSLQDCDNGVIANNVFTSRCGGCGTLYLTHNSSITGNVFFDISYGVTEAGGGNQTNGNLANGNFGENPIHTNAAAWTNVFENPAGITPNSRYRFKSDWAKYNSSCGIYAGTGFSDSALPPVPRIVAKEIPGQTDAAGNLNIKIRVKASE